MIALQDTDELHPTLKCPECSTHSMVARYKSIEDKGSPADPLPEYFWCRNCGHMQKFFAGYSPQTLIIS